MSEYSQKKKPRERKKRKAREREKHFAINTFDFSLSSMQMINSNRLVEILRHRRVQKSMTRHRQKVIRLMI